MLEVAKLNTPNFKSDNVVSINYNKSQQMPMMDYDSFELSSQVESKAQKKQKKQERLQTMSAWGTVGIAAGLIGSLLLSIYAMTRGAKGAQDAVNKELTTAKLIWEDFKNSKTVASLDSKTTAKSLKATFNNIIDGSKLSEAARKWGGGKDKNTDIIYLYGHGGTGKTYVAKQYAQQIDALFTNVKYPDIGSPYKDAASMKISNLFDQIIEMANKNKDRKIVVCIDEIDAVIKKVNDAAHGSEEASKSRAAVLTGLDRLREKCSNVTVIATSNYHPKNGIVDEIALRRFNNQVEVPLPDKGQIEGLLEMYLKDIDAIGKDFTKNSDVQSFINKLQKEGYSNGEIELICEEAGKIFRATLKDVPDAELKKHPFNVDYLEEALKMKGTAASKTNKLMDVKEGTNFKMPKLDFWTRLKILLGRDI